MPAPPKDASPPAAGPIRRLGAWLARRSGAAWDRVRPRRRALRAISAAAVAAALGLGAYFGSRLRTGQPWLEDIGLGALVALAFVLAAALVLALVPVLLRALSQTVGRLGLAAVVAVLVLLDLSGLSTGQAAAGAALVVGLAALAVGPVAALTGASARDRGRLATTVVATGGLAGVAGVAMAVFWLLGDGSDRHLVAVPAAAAEHPAAPVDAPDPAQRGPLAVRTLTYGSGDDRHRPEYGAAAALLTQPVNGKPFFTMPGGWRGDLRREFWGFGAAHLPLNGRVWYPDGAGPFPLVLVVHGNHYMAEFSDPGYGYLGELLASRGFIVVSVDENFLNGGGPVFAGTENENDCRAWLLLEHLRQWRTWNETEGNPFFRLIDLEHIALIGHSRGGEAVYHAALFNRLSHYPEDASVGFDYGFAIRGVISIAPSDGQYRPAGRRAELADVSFFTIQGGHDADVSSFVGDRMFRRTTVRQPEAFKASLYVHRANHGQFNTVWGAYDVSGPKAPFLNRRAYLTGEEQRRIAAVYFGAFVEATLHEKREYVALFRDHRAGAAWLPDTPMVSRYEDARFSVLADYEEDFDVTTTTAPGGRLEARGLVLWREGDIPLRGGSRRDDNGVFLGWHRSDSPPASGAPVQAVEASAGAGPPPRYAIALPAGFASKLGLSGTSALVFGLAASSDRPKAADYSPDDEATGEREPTPEAEDQGSPEPLDLTIELVSAGGATARLPLSRFGALLPPLKSVFTRSAWTEAGYSAHEPELQTFRMPLAAFAQAEPGFAPGELTEVRLLFDRSEKGVVILDRVGFE